MQLYGVQVVWGSEGLPLPTCAARPEVRIVRLEDLERAGSREPRAHTPPRPSSVATISYTSGTTGTPKGTSSPKTRPSSCPFLQDSVTYSVKFATTGGYMLATALTRRSEYI